MRQATIVNHPVPEYNAVNVGVGDTIKKGDILTAVNGKQYEYVGGPGVVISDSAFFHVGSAGHGDMLYMVDHNWLVKPNSNHSPAVNHTDLLSATTIHASLNGSGVRTQQQSTPGIT